MNENILGEVTITVTHSCGHSGTVEVLPGRAETVRADVATRPCQACQWAAEAVRPYEAGDLDGTQETLVGWVQMIVAANDHRARRLMALVKQVD